jgi:formylglycine-generating enzyme required for sulfatase activity
MPRKLRIFLCHASQDKPAVRELYARLNSEAWIDPWLDEENLLPGQDFDLEIYKATRDADAIIICLSKVSVAKEGYVNKEIRRALEIAQEKPEGAIYVIPLRLDDCTPSFEQLKKLQWADYFTPNAHERLLKALRVRAEALKLQITENTGSIHPTISTDQDLDLYKFIQIPPTEEVPYSFYIGKYPVTNSQYQRFLNAPDFADKAFWVRFPKYNEECIQIERWENEGWVYLQKEMNERGNSLKPRYWNTKNFGIFNPENPVVGVSWYESVAYCYWLKRHWNELVESHENSGLQPKEIRLPLDLEWSSAAGGEKPEDRCPWDVKDSVTEDSKQITRRANTTESKIGHTTPVYAYLRGASPHGVMDMAGNVWEWQGNYRNMEKGWLSLRGCSWNSYSHVTRVAHLNNPPPEAGWSDRIGFRVVVISRT